MCIVWNFSKFYKYYTLWNAKIIIIILVEYRPNKKEPHIEITTHLLQIYI